MTGTDHITRYRGPIRFLLVSLGVTQLAIGLWALLGSHSFYNDFPFGQGWVSADGPYNQHLLTDFGGLYIATGLIALFAGISLRRPFVQVTAIAFLAFSVPHLIYHSLNLEPYSTANAIANVLALAGVVIGPITILLLARRPQARAVPDVATTGRIDGVPRHRAGPLVRGVYRETRKMTGKVVEPVAVTAHHPLMLMGYSALELALERSDRVPKRLKMLAELKASTMTGCEFCIDIGSKLSRDHGVSEQQMREFLVYRESDAFSPVEKLVIDYAAGMSRTPVDVSDDMFAQLRQHFDEAQLVELTAAIATENYRGRFNGAFGLGSEGFSDGVGAVEAEPAPA
jgi:AhpD family alkylhydroperoxidase